MQKRAQVIEDLLECLAGSARTPQDWRAVVGLAGETLTIGTLSEIILSKPGAVVVPVEIHELLMTVRDRARERNERLTAQLSEMLPSLNALGIEPVVMRGMARLISTPHSSARLISDIDLLIPAERLRECMQALTELEYQVVKGGELNPAAIVFCRSRDVGMIDLHTQVQPFYLQLGYGSIARLCERTGVGTGYVLLPSPTCQLLLTIVHDQLHDGDYWRGLVDLRHLVDTKDLVAEGIDWTVLGGFFPSGSPARALQVYLRTARSLIKIAAPENLCGGIWARLQLLRRKLQTRVESLRPALTLLTIAVDPPPNARPGTGLRKRIAETSWSKPRRFIDHYLRPIPSGKFPLR
jgi:putative nucleotidyltransferase-like protein